MNFKGPGPSGPQKSPPASESQPPPKPYQAVVDSMQARPSMVIPAAEMLKVRPLGGVVAFVQPNNNVLPITLVNVLDAR